MSEAQFPELLEHREEPSKEARVALRQAILADLQPVVPLSRQQRAVRGLACLVVGCGVAGVTFGAKALVPHAWRLTAVATSVVTIAVTSLVVARGLMSFGTRAAQQRTVLTAAVVGGWFAYLVLVSAALEWRSAVEFHAFGCAAHGLLGGAAAVVGLLWLWRRTSPWTPSLDGSLLGAAAGCAASAGVGVACGIDAGGHLLLGHGGAVLLLTGLGAVVGRKWLAP